ncbi:hypothetical protein F0919_14025 [Taibaiella lutea]|uniref:Uncharacterized protein n=1 Tax=Taibaiella lutea TaxID=2608001 RepID=A0A5M6CGU8_9BACT|nr:hypothetical protein [Taibaiella lutea]KAA5533650.1 hypothetical protein F0919_14025 [Taibaiella lutea]
MSFDPERSKKNFDKMRGYAGMGMGAVYLIIGITILTYSKVDPFHIGTGISYVVSGLMLAYGIFRIYRGYKLSKGEGL